MIHALHMARVATPLEALRRADLLSSLNQETEGDFSSVSAMQLADAEAAHAGKEARIGQAAAILDGHISSAMPLPSPAAAAAAIEATAAGLRRAGVLAILRAHGPSVDVVVARGVELAAMGCM